MDLEWHIRILNIRMLTHIGSHKGAYDFVMAVNVICASPHIKVNTARSLAITFYKWLLCVHALLLLFSGIHTEKYTDKLYLMHCIM